MKTVSIPLPLTSIEGAQALADRIIEHWPGSKTIIMPCNGLDSYYAEMHGLIIGYGMGVASGQ